MNAFRRDDQRTADLARQYGDNVISYVGVHGDPALQLMKKGKLGLALLDILPEDFFLTADDRTPSTFWKTALALLRRHPTRFHYFIGILGNKLLFLPPAYCQIIFWSLASFITLLILKSGYALFKVFVASEE